MNLIAFNCSLEKNNKKNSDIINNKIMSKCSFYKMLKGKYEPTVKEILNLAKFISLTSEEIINIFFIN